MNRLARRLMIWLLILIIIASVLAGFVALQPLLFNWTSTVLRYTKSSAIDYIVDLHPGSFGNQSTAGQDLIYLDNLVKGIQPTFIYTFEADRPVDVEAFWQVDATIRVLDAADPSAALLNQTIPLVAKTGSQSAGTQNWIMNQPLKIDLAKYRDMATTFAANNPANLKFELAVVLNLDLTIIPAIASEVIHINEPLVLVIPLNQPQYRIERELPAAMPEWASVRQNVHYLVQLTGIPFFFFPIAAGLAFVVLVIFLAFTRSTPKDRFRGRLKRMLRLARGRLMLIGDKAWDPEWCVAVTDYRTMVRTAKRLKHPIFCYIDKMKPWPVAYFYVYYGENNYCHIYTEHPELLHDAGLARDRQETVDDEADNNDTGTHPHGNGIGIGGSGGSGGSGGLGGHVVPGGSSATGGPGTAGGQMNGRQSTVNGRSPTPVSSDTFSQMDDDDQDELDESIPVLPEIDDPSSSDRRPDVTLNDLTDRK